MLRNLNNWETEEYEPLLNILYSISLNEDQVQPLWTPISMGQFTMGSFYKPLTKRKNDEENFPCRQIWRLNAPPRIAFFA